MNRTQAYLESLTSVDSIEVGLLVDLLIQDAVSAVASDIHIEPWDGDLVVRFRLNGVLEEWIRMPEELMEKTSGRLKILANLISYEVDRPQEGHAQVSVDTGGVELRISFFPVIRGSHHAGVLRGEKIVIRIFDPTQRSFHLGELGLPQPTLSTLQRLLSVPSGMILLTGPTGAGKTTVIYAALSHLVAEHGAKISISTVEDPVEYNLPMVSQAQINLAKEFTFPVALRSLMRQDPEVIMVGEIRDAETAAIAIQASLTGHLVISTIHSGNTAGVFARMINMQIEPFLLASGVVGVLGMRLIRKNCESCAEPYRPDEVCLRLLPEEFVHTVSFRRGRGCDHCGNTGYGGRTSVTEMLEVGEALREGIMDRLPTRKLQEIASNAGMQTLWQAALQRVAEGQTTLEEVLRCIPQEG